MMQCNQVDFYFIKYVIERVTILFGKKENINNFNCLKRTKFGIEK